MVSPATICQICNASRRVKYVVFFVYIPRNRNGMGLLCEACYDFIKNQSDYRIVKVEQL